ncbi:copper amine oxidase N-terminal domain-containing protein [Cohnella mopanensis]|uniref:copper amine oxidase N-terminal domain-containing protein n=1 Tax=Cohnella mopanensis TaxID=2911966 RepID=UPI001EF76EB9|nr:copper amine oxidase N-terminal domain-containing protein [Cohnella mopanensis]
MRKFISVLATLALLFSVVHLPEAKAASAIKIVINGQELITDQAPVVVNGGYTLVPLRGIFEALGARVQWNQKAQTVTGTKGDTTIVLKLGASTATINNKTVTLDASARSIGGRTMVPIRFVSESLGDDVSWNKNTQSVVITTKAPKEVAAVSSVTVSTVSQFGDGRDLQVNFTPPSDQTNVDSYRLLVVKAENASSFNSAKAQIVGSANYTSLSKYNPDQRTTLTAQSRDVDGALLRTNQAYKVFVLTVGNGSYALSASSVSISLSSSPAVNAATNVKIDDVGDFGDGRDLQVSFTKAANESNITGYRVMIVKSANASQFDLVTANGMSSSYSTTVSKNSNNTLSVTLNSSSRDTSGELIRTGVAYTAFVLALSNNTGALTNGLSVGSASVTLGTTPQVPTITNVEDIDNYGDGRDLRVSFNKATDETRINSYRIFVVRDYDSGTFNLTEANKLSSQYYYDVSRTGNSTYSVTLSSSMRDVKGQFIQNGVAYRVFVMGVSVNSSSYPNTLSGPSQSITLADTGVTAVSYVTVSDVSDYNNGQDLQVSFPKVNNEAKITEYRVFVVREANASIFNLSMAMSMPTSQYTTFSKTGTDIITKTLSSSARDTSGIVLQNGVSYKVFVMTVGTGGTGGTNALSYASSAITLTNNGAIPMATNVSALDVGDFNDSRDLRVSFTKAANETNIANYRVFIVRNEYANNFTLATANSIQNASYYSNIAKKGTDISEQLPAGVLDIYGLPIQNGISYRIFVMSVGYGVAYGSNSLSAPSAAITLSGNSVLPVTIVSVADVSDFNDGQDLKITFTKATNETNIDHYRIYVVREANAGAFTLATANAITDVRNYRVVSKGNGATIESLLYGLNDVNGIPIQNGIAYRLFVMSAGGGTSYGTNALSYPSASITLSNSNVPTATNVVVSNNGQNLQVAFNKAADENLIMFYRVLLVRDNQSPSFTLASANSAPNSTVFNKTSGNINMPITPTPTTDAYGNQLQVGAGYYVYVLSMGINGTNSLSLPSNWFAITSSQVPELLGVYGYQVVNTNTVIAGFNKPVNEDGISYYQAFVVPAGIAVNETSVINYASTSAIIVKSQDPSYSTTISSLALSYNVSYQVYILAFGTNGSPNKLSQPSGLFTLKTQ